MNSETSCCINDSYVEAYLGEKEAARYMPVWEKIENGSRLSFNPAAWIFSFLWLFHKKMHREFVVFLAAFFILPVIVGGIAGISRMEGEITPKTVYSKLRKVPVVLEYYPCRCTEHRFENLVKTMPWYKIMLLPIIEPSYYGLGFNSEPAFYFGLFKVLTMLALNIFLGVYGNRLYFRSIRGNILRQLADMSTDEESSRLRILQKSGRENTFKARQRKLAPIFALVCVILPFFYDAVCIIYGYRY